MVAVSQTLKQQDIQNTLRSYLLAVLPPGVEVIAAFDNRVPEPTVGDFIVMIPISKHRLNTNLEDYQDVVFTGWISGSVMNVTAVAQGVLSVGANVYGVGVADGTRISSFGSGSGGTGTYNISVPQTVGSEKLACGAGNLMMGVEFVMQLDVHGPNSADSAQVIITTFRSDYAYQMFRDSGFDIRPLYCEDVKCVPFINAEQQYETRYVIDAHMQANQVVSPPQQYADQLQLSLVEVDTLPL